MSPHVPFIWVFVLFELWDGAFLGFWLAGQLVMKGNKEIGERQEREKRDQERKEGKIKEEHKKDKRRKKGT